MRATLSLIRREFGAYFVSPIAYVVLAAFLAVTGYLFVLSLQLMTASGPTGLAWPMQLMVNDIAFWLVFLVIPPLLTMRLFAEERSTGTLEMLLTAPIRDWQIVAAKFIACYAFYLVLWLPTLLYLPILLAWGWGPVEPVSATVGLMAVGGAIVVVGLMLQALIDSIGGAVVTMFGAILLAVGVAWYFLGMKDVSLDTVYFFLESGVDPRPVMTTYLGLALVGGMFLALGMWVSSLVKSQLIAAFLAIFGGLVFIVAGVWRPDLDTSGLAYQVLYYFTVPLHFERNFSRGLIDTRNLVFYTSVALLCLFLTVRSLESRRWR